MIRTYYTCSTSTHDARVYTEYRYCLLYLWYQVPVPSKGACQVYVPVDSMIAECEVDIRTLLRLLLYCCCGPVCVTSKTMLPPGYTAAAAAALPFPSRGQMCQLPRLYTYRIPL